MQWGRDGDCYRERYSSVSATDVPTSWVRKWWDETNGVRVESESYAAGHVGPLAISDCPDEESQIADIFGNCREDNILKGLTVHHAAMVEVKDTMKTVAVFRFGRFVVMVSCP